MTGQGAALQDLAAEAFIYGYPLVSGVAGEHHLAGGPNASVSAPINTFGHDRALVTPEKARAGGIVSPNVDTLYSIAVMDVGPEPLVVRVPPIPDRYYVLQFIDAWTNNFAYIGTRSAGAEAGDSLIVGPGWTGDPPDGMRVIHAPTRAVLVAGRILVDGEADLPAAHRLQDGLAIIPLSSYPELADLRGRRFGDRPQPKPDPGVPPELGFWERLRVWSQAFPPHPEDSEYQQRFQPLGLAATTSPYLDADPSLAGALQAGAADGLAAIDAAAKDAVTVRNTWQAGTDLFSYNRHFFEFGAIDDPAWVIADPGRARLIRGVAARQAIWGNHAYEAFYPSTHVDGDGQPLSGAHRYVLHFNTAPPVEAFWSLTMYDVPDYYPVDNPIGRYGIGDRTPGLVTNPDGSLDLYLQHQAPGSDEEAANWLPAPAGPFRPMLRLYNPRPEAFNDQQWQLPAIQRRD